MPAPRKTHFLLILCALIFAMESVTFARPISQSKKVPVTKQKRTSKATPKQKVDFQRWLNDPNIEPIEKEARKVLGLRIYGAVDCGLVEYEGCIEDDLKWQPIFKHRNRKSIRNAVHQYNKRAAFIYIIKFWAHGSPMMTNGGAEWVEDYRAIVGTKQGEVYEFWREIKNGMKFDDPMVFVHRKWKKPTVQKKGNDILFFDTGQKQK